MQSIVKKGSQCEVDRQDARPLKRGWEMDDAQGPSIYLDYIESGALVKAAVGLEIPLGGAGEKELLLGRDGVRGTTEGGV